MDLSNSYMMLCKVVEIKYIKWLNWFHNGEVIELNKDKWDLLLIVVNSYMYLVKWLMEYIKRLYSPLSFYAKFSEKVHAINVWNG